MHRFDKKQLNRFEPSYSTIGNHTLKWLQKKSGTIYHMFRVVNNRILKLLSYLEPVASKENDISHSQKELM